MVIFLKIALLAVFAWILYQDSKERQVYLFVLPLVALFGGYLFFKTTLYELFLIAILMNVMFVAILMGVVMLYIKLKLKLNIMEAIGLGDIVLLFFLCFLFSTISFMVILISAFVFSLVVHMSFKKKSTHNNVPLAGYVSLFFAITYVAFWTGMIDSLYTI